MMMNKHPNRRDWLQATACVAACAWTAAQAQAATPATRPATARTPPTRPPAAAPAAAPTAGPVLWPHWEAFKKQFVRASGRVISNDADGPRTYSEGQSYALFYALVANDRAVFDAVLQWTEDNLCGGDMTARLPAWLWGQRANGDWGVIDSNPASDADLWIAYALGEAGRLWGERRYVALSALLAARVLREETANLPGLGWTLLPAPQGFEEGPGRWRLNPSYVPMQLMHWLRQQKRLLKLHLLLY
jgi:endoglucanase